MTINVESNQPEKVGGGDWVGGIQIRIEEGRASIVAREWKAREPIPTALGDPLYQVAVSAVGGVGKTYEITPDDLQSIAENMEADVARVIAGMATDVDPGVPLNLERDFTRDARAALASLQNEMSGPISWLFVPEETTDEETGTTFDQRVMFRALFDHWFAAEAVKSNMEVAGEAKPYRPWEPSTSMFDYQLPGRFQMMCLHLAMLHTVAVGYPEVEMPNEKLDALLADKKRMKSLRAIKKAVFSGTTPLYRDDILTFLENKDDMEWCNLLHSTFETYFEGGWNILSGWERGHNCLSAAS